MFEPLAQFTTGFLSVIVFAPILYFFVEAIENSGKHLDQIVKDKKSDAIAHRVKQKCIFYVLIC